MTLDLNRKQRLYNLHNGINCGADFMLVTEYDKRYSLRVCTDIHTGKDEGIGREDVRLNKGHSANDLWSVTPLNHYLDTTTRRNTQILAIDRDTNVERNMWRNKFEQNKD